MEKSEKTHFFKMTGGGNDFVLLDNRKKKIPNHYNNLAKKLCERKFSIGADGLLVLEKSEDSDFRMVYFNADGSRAEMCGNGARCIARFAHLLNIVPETMSFSTDAGIVSAEILGEDVKLKMSLPKNMRLNYSIKVPGGKEINLSQINTGVPHAVVMVSDLEKASVTELGKTIRYHKQFAPQGTNVNFVQQKSSHTLKVRTYERGVEDETLACGTGVVASALICAAQGTVTSPVSCITRGGETLKIHFKTVTERRSGPNNILPVMFEEVLLEGPATVCFKGELDI